MKKDEIMDIEYKYDVTTWKHSGKVNKCEFIMLHHTVWISSLKDMTTYLSKNKAEASCHYIIDPEWLISRIWLDNYILWHAGEWDKIKWYKDIMNQYSIWIEVISDWKEFTIKQVESLRRLVTELQKKHNIHNDKVIRHKDYTDRKTDISDNFYKTAWYWSFEDWKKWNNNEVDFFKLKEDLFDYRKIITTVRWEHIRKVNILNIHQR